jgi:hypothetical protein
MQIRCRICASIPAFAQTAPGDPASRTQAIPEIESKKPLGGPDQGLKSGRSEGLSDRLNSSNGVIAPPSGVDPGMDKPAPAMPPGATPVVPPPPDATPK